MNYMHQFIKIRLVFHMPYLWNEAGDPSYISFLKQVNHYLFTVEVLKKSIEKKIFANILNPFPTTVSHILQPAAILNF